MMKMKTKRVPFAPKARVTVYCSTAKGLLVGDGRILKKLRLEPCGASGWMQPSYLVEMEDKSLKILPHESMKEIKYDG